MSHPDLDHFEQLYRRDDQLLANAPKEDVSKAARILAVNLSQYHAKYGELPAGDH